MDLRPLFAFVVLCLAAPLSAGDGAQVPEPSSLALFSLGLAGLIIGRRVARSKPPSDED